MASDSYDVLILGGGNAGFGVTVPTRKAGMTVAMVEERDQVLMTFFSPTSFIA